MLNLNTENRKDNGRYFENLLDKDWLDLLDLKEEQSLFEEDRSPEKDSLRKIKHNKSNIYNGRHGFRDTS